MVKKLIIISIRQYRFRRHCNNSATPLIGETELILFQLFVSAKLVASRPPQLAHSVVFRRTISPIPLWTTELPMSWRQSSGQRTYPSWRRHGHGMFLVCAQRCHRWRDFVPNDGGTTFLRKTQSKHQPPALNPTGSLTEQVFFWNRWDFLLTWRVRRHGVTWRFCDWTASAIFGFHDTFLTM